MSASQWQRAQLEMEAHLWRECAPLHMEETALRSNSNSAALQLHGLRSIHTVGFELLIQFGKQAQLFIRLYDAMGSRSAPVQHNSRIRQAGRTLRRRTRASGWRRREKAAAAAGTGTGSSRATDETIGSKQDAAATVGAKTKSKAGEAKRGSIQERQEEDQEVADFYSDQNSSPGSNTSAHIDWLSKLCQQFWPIL